MFRKQRTLSEKIGEVYKITITNSIGAYIEIFTLGAILQSVNVPDKYGKLCDVVLGFDTPDEYLQNTGMHGATVGRCANRVRKGEIKLGEKSVSLSQNTPFGQIHGGFEGFNKKNWSIAEEGDNYVTLSLLSPDGDEGYPGNLMVSVKYTFTDDCEVIIDYLAKTDMDTIVNLTNHSYFNLNPCKGDILDTNLKINAAHICECDDNVFPTGRLLDIKNTAFDFTEFKKIGRDIAAPELKFGGYDHNYCLDSGDAAEAYSEESGIHLKCSTTLPGLQLYTTNTDTVRVGKAKKLYSKHSGFCLEAQIWPDSISFENFPSPVLKAGEEFGHRISYAFSVR